jgi:hypothetical protein
MPDFTNALAKGMDAHRRVFFGNSATLVLLDYARDGRRGYDATLTVPNGWHLSSGKEPSDPMVLEIAEKGTVTRALLDEVRAFGINGKVYKILDDGRKAPTYPNKRIWTFQVMPSGEVVDR